MCSAPNCNLEHSLERTLHTVTPEHVITPPEAETNHSTAKENKYTSTETKTGVDVTPQSQKTGNRPTARN
jgi:hypothetical protein